MASRVGTSTTETTRVLAKVRKRRSWPRRGVHERGSEKSPSPHPAGAGGVVGGARRHSCQRIHCCGVGKRKQRRGSGRARSRWRRACWRDGCSPPSFPSQFSLCSRCFPHPHTTPPHPSSLPAQSLKSISSSPPPTLPHPTSPLRQSILKGEAGMPRPTPPSHPIVAILSSILTIPLGAGMEPGRRLSLLIPGAAILLRGSWSSERQGFKLPQFTVIALCSTRSSASAIIRRVSSSKPTSPHTPTTQRTIQPTSPTFTLIKLSISVSSGVSLRFCYSAPC